MNRVPTVAFRVAVAASFLFFGMNRLYAQAQTASPTPAPAAKEAAEEERDPFAPEPAPVLPHDGVGCKRSACKVDARPL
jgi:hypothetical protein